MNQMIDELNRQRAERHRLVDAEYDVRIRLVQDQCKHEWVPATVKINGLTFMAFGCDECKHCRAPMPEPLSNT